MTDRPPPEHTSRMPWPDGFAEPRPAAALRKLAAGRGWDAECTYSRGSVPGVRKDTYRLVHVVAVRFRRGGRAGFVAYEAPVTGAPKWTAKTCLVQGFDHRPVTTGLGVTGVQEYLAESPGWTGERVNVWADVLRAKAAAQAAAAKEKAKNTPKKAKVI